MLPRLGAWGLPGAGKSGKCFQKICRHWSSWWVTAGTSQLWGGNRWECFRSNPVPAGHPALLSAVSRGSHKAVDSTPRAVCRETGLETCQKEFSSGLKHCCVLATLYSLIEGPRLLIFLYFFRLPTVSCLLFFCWIAWYQLNTQLMDGFCRACLFWMLSVLTAACWMSESRSSPQRLEKVQAVEHISGNIRFWLLN